MFGKEGLNGKGIKNLFSGPSVSQLVLNEVRDRILTL
jgi:hypothetical protein